MRVSVFGIGYVGTVSVAGFIQSGHDVIAVDINAVKVMTVNHGKSPILEPDVEALLSSGVKTGRLRALQDTEEAVFSSDISLICVGTPQVESRVELRYVFQVCSDIAKAIQMKQQPHVVVLRSTVPPGTWRECYTLMTQIAGEELVQFAVNPEFLREGTALKDFCSPPYTIVGTLHKGAEEALHSLYADVKAPFSVVEPSVAELLKYTANAWHATKIGFANEIGRIAKELGIDGHEVMDLIVKDTKLNVSQAYLVPGFAFGGSCLPKDLFGLLRCAQVLDVQVPLLTSLHETNLIQIKLAVDEILGFGVKRIAILGLAFKPGTDDLRASPTVLLVKQLLGEGCKIKIFDAAVAEARLVGTNREFIEQNLPHFKQLLAPDLASALENAQLVVVAHATRGVLAEMEVYTRHLPVFDLSQGLCNGSLPAQSVSVFQTS